MTPSANVAKPLLCVLTVTAPSTVPLQLTVVVSVADFRRCSFGAEANRRRCPTSAGSPSKLFPSVSPPFSHSVSIVDISISPALPHGRPLSLPRFSFCFGGLLRRSMTGVRSSSEGEEEDPRTLEKFRNVTERRRQFSQAR